MFFFFKQKTAYEMRISDWSSDVCSSDLDAARDAERVRVARELHDVAGHKLTALTLNLRALAADPQLGAREEVPVSQQLARELLGDLRGVVQALRDPRGPDLAPALQTGRASCRERLGQYCLSPGVAGTIKK